MKVPPFPIADRFHHLKERKVPVGEIARLPPPVDDLSRLKRNALHDAEFPEYSGYYGTITDDISKERWSAEIPMHPEAKCTQTHYPYYGNDNGCRKASRAALAMHRLIPVLSHEGWRNKANDQRYSKRNDDKVVQVAEHWDKVWNEVNRTKRVGCDRSGGDLGVPRCSRVASGDPQSHRVAFEVSGPVLQFVQSGTHVVQLPAKG